MTFSGHRARSLGRLRTADPSEGRALGRPAAFWLLAAAFGKVTVSGSKELGDAANPAAGQGARA